MAKLDNALDKAMTNIIGKENEFNEMKNPELSERDFLVLAFSNLIKAYLKSLGKEEEETENIPTISKPITVMAPETFGTNN